MAGLIIFAGCVRDCAPYLPQVLANCVRFAGTTEKAFFLFAENDFTDATKAILANWCDGRINAHILCFDGLHARLSKRTERIAFLRNQILESIREQGLADYDALCVLDFDEVNAGEITPEGFSAAVEFLLSAPENAGVFAVSDPIYYDIYALRHEHWSPGDCWKAVRAAPAEQRAEVFQTLVCDRQVPIAKTAAPIAVDFGFRRLGALSARSRPGRKLCRPRLRWRGNV